MRSQPSEDKKTETGQPVFERVAPEWEDVNNIGGGEYRFTLDAGKDKQWEVSLLKVIGGSLPLANEVNAVWLGCGRKSGSTLSLWKRTPLENETPENSVAALGEAWVKALSDAGVPVTGVQYTSHQDAIAAAKSNTNAVVSWSQ